MYSTDMKGDSSSLPYLFTFAITIDFVSVTPSLAQQTPSLNCRCALAEPFAQSGKSPEAKLEAERLMFLELTQGSILTLNIYMFTNLLS